MNETPELPTRVQCGCHERHESRRVVLTGGPGAGKTAVLELVRQHFCRHVDVLPESASILFSGGFRRGASPAGRAATQRAIFHTQRGLEAVTEAEVDAALVVCDRGTVDGFAYWPSADDFFLAMGSSRGAELARYAGVVHLRTPSVASYNHDNPLRIENAVEAAAIDARIADAWRGHAHYAVVESTVKFLEKAQAAIALLEPWVPACCRRGMAGTSSAP